MFKDKSRLKIGLSVVLVIVLVLLGFFIVGYKENEEMIEEYNSGKYATLERDSSILGLMQPYIPYYNQGNVYFQQGIYDEALAEYEKALEKNPPWNVKCDINVNMALSKVSPLDPSYIGDAEMKIVEEAKEILTRNGCANADGVSGHDEEAQTLYNELDQIEPTPPSSSQQSNPPSSSPDSDSESEEDSEESEQESKQEELDSIGREAVGTREDDMSYWEDSADFNAFEDIEKPW